MHFHRKNIVKILVIILIISASIRYAVDQKSGTGYGSYRIAKIHSSQQSASPSRFPPIEHRSNPAKNVVFLKVHKVGGSTLMNLFYRYAFAKNLNLVLPIRSAGGHWNYLGYNTTLHKKNIVPLPRDEHYNIVCNHVIYNKHAFSKIMPNDTVYITILRNPADQFVSAAMYYDFFRNLKQKTKAYIGEQSIPENFHEYFINKHRYSTLNTYDVRNKMSRDLGLPISRFDDKVFIQEFINNVSHDYQLVMLMEYFTQSVILLRRHLAWTLQDVVYIPLNINSEKKEKDILMYGDDIDLLLEWNYADYQLHKHFEQIYMKQVEAEGPSLKVEVTYFEGLLQRIYSFCNSDEDVYIVEKSEWSDSFDVSRKQCKMMSSDALPVIREAIQRSRKRFNKWARSNGEKVLN